MNSSILQVIPHLNEENVDFLLRPLEGPGQRSHTPSLDALEEILEIPLAKLLVVGVLWPAVEGPLVLDHLDIHEPDFLEYRNQSWSIDERPTEDVAGLLDLVYPLDESVVRRQRPIVTVWPHVTFKQLDVATWLKVAVTGQCADSM